jgi:putative SOS response-associated peptidase YedK
VLADGFYEWKKEGAGREGKGRTKVPHWIHLPSREAFTMAGIWERWDPTEGDTLYTFSILTTEAGPEIKPIHPRMPVIIPGGGREEWLDPNAEPGELAGLLRPYQEEPLEAFPVSTLVNSPRNDNPACIEPAGSEPRAETAGGGDAEPAEP